jgi:glucan phosphoethanolaminetransferase (alkaline phosphatase superfamily)
LAKVYTDNLDLDVEKEIEEQYLQSVIDNYLPKLKIVFIILIVIFSVIQHVFQNNPSKDKNAEITINRLRVAIAFTTICLLWIHFFPKKYALLIPVKIFLIME